MRMDIVFFLGSGISLDSGLPNTKCLTEFLFCKNFQVHSSGRYIEAISDCSRIKEIKIFLKHLKSDYESYIKKYVPEKPFEELNYEDLFYILEQLISVDELYFKDYSIAYFKKWFQSKHDFKYDIYKKLIKDSTRYISEVIRSTLEHKHICGLNILNEIKNNSDVEKVHIFTLNHDRLIEDFLGDEVIDGFKKDGQLRFFEPLEFEREDKKLYLYKLHGSINWFYWSKINPNGNRYPTLLGTCDLEEDELNDLKGNKWRKEEDIPLFLTGGNKIFRYYYQGYFELHYKFLECLKKNKNLIVSGYGGSDNLINFRIKDWLESDKENKIIFLYEDEEIPHYFLRFKSRYTIIPKWFSDTTINDITNALT